MDMSGEKEPTSPSANNGNASAVCTKKSCPKEWKHSSQEKSNSCVIASSKNMIKMLAGKDISEEKLRIEMKEIMKKPKHDFNKDGINPAHAKTLLKNPL